MILSSSPTISTSEQCSPFNITVELDFNTARASVPEPFSIVGMFMAFGWGIILKREQYLSTKG
ncbi:MAG: PEP-CTERM sorting domain-containing protein [Xenococcaceae cyanobacterium MO_188.B32]|nr:PEP-CTERM sorting domain-containing protein [Xenococcaceae cyanobacterium MO_188.B32]